MNKIEVEVIKEDYDEDYRSKEAFKESILLSLLAG